MGKTETAARETRLCGPSCDRNPDGQHRSILLSVRVSCGIGEGRRKRLRRMDFDQAQRRSIESEYRVAGV